MPHLAAPLAGRVLGLWVVGRAPRAGRLNGAGNKPAPRPFSCKLYLTSAMRLHPDLQPYAPTDADPFDRVKAAHLLNRAGFGGTPEEVERVLHLGPADAVDELLDFPDAPAAEQSRDDLPDHSAIENVPLSYKAQEEALRGVDDPEEKQKTRNEWMGAHRRANTETAEWWLERMAYGKYPMQEKLTLFWHGHFTTSADMNRGANQIWRQNELLRTFAAGNFAAFTHAVARDPAMIDYLNNQQNTKYAPNENFARELMELFTLGLDRYSPRDIREVARAFTGWHHDGDAYVFRASLHDDGPKSVFGSKPYDLTGDDVVDVLMRHPAMPPFVAGRLFEFFAYADADPALLKSLGAVLTDNDYELRPVLRALFNSRAFYSSAAVGTQIKSPIQLVVGTQRLLGVDPAEGRDFRRLRGSLQQMGQVPLMPPNVKGWPGGRAWINTGTLFARANVAARIAKDVRASDLVPENVFAEPGPIVDRWVERLIGRPINPDKRKALLAVAGNPATGGGLRKAVQLIVSLPEYQLC